MRGQKLQILALMIYTQGLVAPYPSTRLHPAVLGFLFLV